MNEFDDLNLEEAREMDETPETRDLAGESDAEDLPEETGLPSPEETELPEPEDLLEDRPALRELTDEEREALAIPPAERTWHQTELADLARHGDFETQKSFLRDENGDLAETYYGAPGSQRPDGIRFGPEGISLREAKDYGDVNNLLRNMEAQTADRLALSGEWAEALDALWESYDDWSHSQTYLHIVSHHDAVDDAEAMYRRAIAFGETEELSEFHAELSDLRDQLRLIAEMEALNIRNVL